MSAVDELIARPAFSHGPETDSLFRRAMEESFALHRQGCPEFRAVLERAGLSSSDALAGLPLERWPHVFVNVFKERDMVTGRREDVVLELTSSGTGGRQSRNFLDPVSLERVRRIARNVYDGLGLVAPEERVCYVCFSYDPKVADDLGTAFTDELLTSFTGIDEVVYAIRWDEGRGDFRFDLEGTMRRLEEFAERGAPVRLVGFPAFIHHILTVRVERGLPRLDLGQRSFALTGGGWKTHEGRAITREAFSEECRDLLGMPVGNVRDLFGMVEHGVPYVQCERGSFHVPVYGLPIVRHPLTLEPQPPGEPGLLHLMTPYWTSYPAPSVLTTDMALVGPPCGCGRGGPTLVIVGRGGVRKHKGCAIQAAELLEGR